MRLYAIPHRFARFPSEILNCLFRLYVKYKRRKRMTHHIQASSQGLEQRPVSLVQQGRLVLRILLLLLHKRTRATMTSTRWSDDIGAHTVSVTMHRHPQTVVNNRIIIQRVMQPHAKCVGPKPVVTRPALFLQGRDSADYFTTDQ